MNIISENVISFLKRSVTGFYDIVFADPPYGYELYSELMKSMLNVNFSIFVLEHSGEGAGMFNVNEFDIIEKKIGMTNFTILNKKD